MKKYILLFIFLIVCNSYAISKIPYSHENLSKEEFYNTLESMERRVKFFFDDNTILATDSEIKNLTTITKEVVENHGLELDVENGMLYDTKTGKEYRIGKKQR